MESLSSYIPTDRLHALANGQALPDRSDGAVLFADIAGFTALTEALAQTLGPQRGAEALTSHINQIYDALIAQVDRYGGSVISFSGDAVTCFFDADDGRRATACALAMQQALGHQAAIPLSGGGSAALAMKVAVASGPVRRFLVGDPEMHLIDVLAGDTLYRLAEAEHHAAKGQVVLDGQSARRLRDALRVAAWPGAPAGHAVVEQLLTPVALMPWPGLEGDAVPEAELRRWVLPAIYERLQHGQGTFLAELRPAVALFLGFDGFDYDGNLRAGEHLDAYIRWVQAVIGRYDGALLQLTIGDKGSYLYAAFGAPTAHDDDIGRAVATALELRSPPASLPVAPSSMRIGLSQGVMRTGAYGGVTRRTYGVLGNEVNFAARLMQQAR